MLKFYQRFQMRCGSAGCIWNGSFVQPASTKQKTCFKRRRAKYSTNLGDLNVSVALDSFRWRSTPVGCCYRQGSFTRE